MKKYFLIAGFLVIMILSGVSCGGGISQQEYDKMTGDLAAKNAEIETLNNKHEQANSDLEDANTKIERANREISIFNTLFLPALTGEIDLTTREEQDKMIQQIELTIQDLGDDGLQKRYNLMKFSGDSEAAAAFFIYLLEDLEATLK